MKSAERNGEWQGWLLRDLFNIKHGYAFDGKFFTTCGQYVLLTPGNFYDAGGFKHKSQEKHFVGEVDEQYILNRNDLLVAMTEQAEGLLGSSALIPESKKYLHNQRLGLVTQLRADRVDKRFLFYLFNTWQVRTQIRASATGTKVRHTSPSRIGEVKVHIPGVPTQRKIAAVVSAYDDLIENNTRRIAILEEMAQALFRDWFVRFRFPGRENIPLVPSQLGEIPQGWVVSTLKDACSSVNDGDWIETKDQGGTDYRLLQVSNIGTGSFVETETYRYITEETYKRLRCQEVIEGEILISRMPKPIGRAWLVTDMSWKMITAVDVAIAKARPGVSTGSFLVHYLNSPEHIEQAEKHATGTTRPRVTRSALCSIPFILPSFGIQESFHNHVEPSISLITNLRRRNQNLRQARDLLLPKLIAGQLDVEHLDIDAGTELLETNA